MADTPYAHLHVHTEYSMLDGAARLKELFKEVARHQMTHVAMTDHGNMFGAAEFHRQAKDAGVTPVIGIEAYVAPESRRNTSRILWGQPHQKRDDVSASGSYLHKTIWARNNEGLHNLFKLTSRSYAEGWMTKYARMDKEILAEHAAGLMASTGCPSGELQTRLRLGQYDEALRSAADYQDIFGKENYFLELMDHGLDIETRVRDGLIEIGKKLNIPPVVTNDSHYSKRPTPRRRSSCSASRPARPWPTRTASSSTAPATTSSPRPRCTRSTTATSGRRAAATASSLIADRVDTAGMFEFVNLMPRFPIPAEFESEDALFAAEVWKGMDRRYPGGYDETREAGQLRARHHHPDGVPGLLPGRGRLHQLGEEQRRRGRPGPRVGGRVIVAYAMGITDLDPLDHGLIFERFLNPERISMPDIDIDFDERGRADVIRYVTQRWGERQGRPDHHLRDDQGEGRHQGLVPGPRLPLRPRRPHHQGVPARRDGQGHPAVRHLRRGYPRYGEAGDLRNLYATEPEIKQIIDTAKGIEGLIRQPGVHAAGVIMSAEPLTDHIPVWTRHTDGAVITQFDYPTCEGLGLLKMDFLGLRNLTIMSDAVRPSRTTGRSRSTCSASR